MWRHPSLSVPGGARRGRAPWRGNARQTRPRAREDPAVLLAMAGKISTDLRAAILSRPQLFAELIRSIKSIPDHTVLRIVREVRDGNW